MQNNGLQNAPFHNAALNQSNTSWYCENLEMKQPAKLHRMNAEALPPNLHRNHYDDSIIIMMS